MSSSKVLLVEDDPDQVLMYETALKEAGYQIISCGTEQEAHDLAISEKPDLILLDLLLIGEAFGIDIIKRLKKDARTKKFTIVVLTNYQKEGLVERCLQAGARDYLNKSELDPLELTKKIKEYLV